jgi:hypothetical protein
MARKPAAEPGKYEPNFLLSRLRGCVKSRYTMGDYASTYEVGDYPNAIAIWDVIAKENYRFLLKTHKGKYNRSLPGIISSFMPKSGGTFLFNRMIQSLGYVRFEWGITKLNSHTEVYPTPSAVKVYRRGGFFCHSHALPTPYFRLIMERLDIGPIWVHLRNPAEACLAAYFHYQGEGQGEGKLRASRRAAIQAEKAHLRKEMGFVLEDWPSFYRQWLSFYSGWIYAWLSYEDERPGSVLFTYFDELNDVPALLIRVFEKYGYTPCLQSIANQLPEDRRRIDGNHDWRAGLSKKDISSQSESLDIWERALALRRSTTVSAPASPPRPDKTLSSDTEI